MYQLFLYSHFHSNSVLDNFTSSSGLGIESLFLTSSEFVSFMGEKEGGGGGGVDNGLGHKVSQLPQRDSKSIQSIVIKLV